MRFRRILGSKGVYLSAGKGGKLNKKAVFFDDGGIGGNFGGCIPAQLSQQRLVFFSYHIEGDTESSKLTLKSRNALV